FAIVKEARRQWRQERSIEVAVPGHWYARAADNPAAEWARICDTPGSVLTLPGEVYRLKGARQGSDDELAGLASLRRLASFPRPEVLLCDRLTDAGLVHLEGLASLRHLELLGCALATGAGLAHLKGCAALEQLDLPGWERVTDAGLAHLSGLTSLQSLD